MWRLCLIWKVAHRLCQRVRNAGNVPYLRILPKASTSTLKEPPVLASEAVVNSTAYGQLEYPYPPGPLYKIDFRSGERVPVPRIAPI